MLFERPIDSIRPLRSWQSVAVLLLIPMLATLAQADVHKDTTHGFKITTPRGWTEVPLQLDEDWIVGKFMSKREDIYNDPENGWTWKYTPEMRILVFPKGTAKSETKTLHEESDAEKGTQKIVRMTERNFLNYKDFKKNSFSFEGFYFSDEKESKVGKIPTTQYEVKVERMSFDGPKRIVAWVYHLADMDIAVEYTVIEDRYDDHRGTLLSSLKSFRTIEREKSDSGDDVAGVIEEFAMHFGLDELSPKEREEARKHLEKIAHKKAAENLPKGWKSKKVGRCLVLSHDCEDYASDVAVQVTAIMDWLDKNLYYIGPEEYVRSPILRVCKDQDEESIFRRGSQGWGGISTEIVTHKDNRGWFDFQNSQVNGRALDIWLQERDKELAWSMPQWFRSGLRETFQNVRVKGRKIEFLEGDEMERNGWRVGGRELTPIPASELFRKKASAFSGAESAWQLQRQSAILVRWLLVGKGSKSSKTKKILADYLMSLSEVIRRIKAEEEAGIGKDAAKPKTEEEEEEYFRKQRNSWQDQANRIAEETFEATFAGWDDDDWDKFDKSFLKSVK